MWLATIVELEQNCITPFSVLTKCSSEFVENFYRLFTPSSHLRPFVDAKVDLQTQRANTQSDIQSVPVDLTY
jgi:hypothetical protein